MCVQDENWGSNNQWITRRVLSDQDYVNSTDNFI